jgi:hypothetical protein
MPNAELVLFRLVGAQFTQAPVVASMRTIAFVRRVPLRSMSESQ